ncbi:MAG TPA: hypothetical protein PKM43_22830, partial [Verrucomicrobiota bacterium]|nr:hypothetical protein [Verrucomicrobiota bacterium]
MPNQIRTIREPAAPIRHAFVKIFSGQAVKQTLVNDAQGMKANGFIIGLSAEQFPDHALEQNVVPLQ